MKPICSIIVSFLPRSFLAALFYCSSQELQRRKKEEVRQAIQNLVGNVAPY